MAARTPDGALNLAHEPHEWVFSSPFVARLADTHHAELATGVNYAALANTADAAGELPGQLNLLTDGGNTDGPVAS